MVLPQSIHPGTDVAPITKQQELWAEAVATKKQLAKRNNAHKMLAVDNFTCVQTNLKSLEGKYSSRKTSTFLQRLDPAFERLAAFSRAISSFVQHDPTHAVLVRV